VKKPFVKIRKKKSFNSGELFPHEINKNSGSQKVSPNPRETHFLVYLVYIFFFLRNIIVI